jgi:peptidyl-prolyl cis-trans isomerase C
LPRCAEAQSHAAVSTLKDHQVFIPGEVLVRFCPNITLDDINSFIKTHNWEILDSDVTSGFYRLRVSKPVEEVTASYQSHPIVEYVEPNYIFAEVGGEFITLMEVQMSIQRMIPLARRSYTQPKAKESLLRFLIHDKLFSIAAKECELHRLPEVQREINRSVEKTLGRVYRKRIQTGTVSQKELMDYYNKNIEKFRAPEQIKGRRILVETKEEGEEILKLVKAGVDFDKIARERSKDSAAEKGGEFGWLARGRMIPAVDQVAFALDKGEVSAIIETQLGYYIIKVEDKRSPGELPFSEVRNKIKYSLEAGKQKEELERKIRELEEKYQVKIHSEFLSKVKVTVTDRTGREDIIQILREAIERPY